MKKAPKHSRTWRFYLVLALTGTCLILLWNVSSHQASTKRDHQLTQAHDDIVDPLIDAPAVGRTATRESTANEDSALLVWVFSEKETKVLTQMVNEQNPADGFMPLYQLTDSTKIAWNSEADAIRRSPYNVLSFFLRDELGLSARDIDWTKHILTGPSSDWPDAIKRVDSFIVSIAPHNLRGLEGSIARKCPLCRWVPLLGTEEDRHAKRRPGDELGSEDGYRRPGTAAAAELPVVRQYLQPWFLTSGLDPRGVEEAPPPDIGAQITAAESKYKPVNWPMSRRST